MTKTRDKFIVALFAFAILVGIMARFVRIAERKTINHDEAWSYLNATGHLGEYEDNIYNGKSYPVGAWVPAREWKRLIQIEDSLVFDQITADNVRIESHPPMYVWVLHIWTLLFGANVWAGMALNIFIDLLILLLLLMFAFNSLKNLPEAMLVGAVWILSPISIDSSAWIRLYELFTLFSVLFAYLTFLFFYVPEKLTIKPLQIFALIIVTIAGLLTHFYFSIVIATGVLLVGLKSVLTKDKTRFIMLFISLGIAGILFVLIYPKFYTHFLRYDQSTFDLDWLGDFTYRFNRTIRINFLLFAPIFLMAALAILEYIYTSKIAGINEFRKQLVNSAKDSLKKPSIIYIWGFSILIISALILLYLARVSPQHAMAARYISIASPFIAFLPVFFLRLSHLKTLPVVLFCAGIIMLGVATSIYPTIRAFTGIDSITTKPSTTGVVVIDNLAHGVVLTVNYSLDDDLEVFTGNPEDLINNPQNWLLRLTEEGGLYVSTAGGFGATLQHREKILDLIEKNSQVVLDSEMPWEVVKDWGDMVKTYRVIPKSSKQVQN